MLKNLDQKTPIGIVNVMKKQTLIAILALSFGFVSCNKIEATTTKNDEGNTSLVKDASADSTSSKEIDDSTQKRQAAIVRGIKEGESQKSSEGVGSVGATVGNTEDESDGALGGAVLGGIIGHQSGKGLEGAAIGAAAGGVAGAVVGGAVKKEEENDITEKE